MDPLKIIKEDNDIIVCYKPARIATQTRRLGQQDMESLLRNYRVRKGESPYIGIIHRLDQPVEGIMVFAKNQKAAAALSRQVQTRSIGKHYYALVYTDGSLPKKGSLTDYLLFDPKQNHTTVVDKTSLPEACEGKRDSQNKHRLNAGKSGLPQNNNAANAQKAVLDYEIKNETNGIALLDIVLHTGRHHQIRVQFAHRGCPLVGDTKYGSTLPNGVEFDVPGMPNSADASLGSQPPAFHGQLALCSYRMVFLHPTTGEAIDLRIQPENPEFSRFLSR